MGDFSIPKKKRSEFPERRTISLSSGANLKLSKLDDKGVDIPQLIRDAIDEYLSKKEVNEILKDVTCQS